MSIVIRHQFAPPFGMYELLPLGIKDYSGVGNGELRAGKRDNGHLTISSPSERMGRLSEGGCGTSTFEGNVRGASKADISGHFNHPEYAIMRPGEYTECLRVVLNTVQIGRYAIHWRTCWGTQSIEGLVSININILKISHVES